MSEKFHIVDAQVTLPQSEHTKCYSYGADLNQTSRSVCKGGLRDTTCV